MIEQTTGGSLVLLCAPARAGKSTYGQKWLSQIDNHKKVIVNSDHVRLAISGQRYNKHSEPFVHVVTDAMVKSLFIGGWKVLVDETNTLISSIRKWLSIDHHAEVIWLNTPIDVCLARATSTNQEDLFPVIRRHFKNIEKLADYGGCPSYYSLYKRLDASLNLLRIETNPNSLYIPLVEIKGEEAPPDVN